MLKEALWSKIEWTDAHSNLCVAKIQMPVKGTDGHASTFIFRWHRAASVSRGEVRISGYAWRQFWHVTSAHPLHPSPPICTIIVNLFWGFSDEGPDVQRWGTEERSGGLIWQPVISKLERKGGALEKFKPHTGGSWVMNLCPPASFVTLREIQIMQRCNMKRRNFYKGLHLWDNPFLASKISL